jgi:hypothetical protein
MCKGEREAVYCESLAKHFSALREKKTARLLNVKAGGACKNQTDSDVSPSAHSWRPRKSNASAALKDLTL